VETATILLTDVEGSTALATSAGDEVARERLRVHEDVVRTQLTAHGGRQVKGLGDGFLLQFTSAREALACALGIQQHLHRYNASTPHRPLRVRVGVHTGEVSEESGDLFGQAVNAAERITGKAKGGQILLSDVTRRLVRSIPGCSFRDRGRLTLKGFPERWRLFEMVWEPDDAPSHDRTPFVNRDELPELARALARSASGRGGLLVLAGEAGVGKTRLAEEAIATSGLVALRGTASQRGTTPYAPLVAALREFLRRDPTGLADTGSIGAYLGTLLPELGPPPDPGNRETLFEAVRGALHAIARRDATVLFIDDLQWADAATLEILPSIASAAQEWRLLVLGAYRSDEIPRGHPLRKLRADLKRAGGLAELVVEPLDARATVHLAATALGQDIGPTLGAALYDRTQGIPFFIEELAAVLKDSSLLTGSAKGIELEPGAQVPIPETIRDAIRLRANGLSAEARASLEAAAVVGVRVPLEILAALGEDAFVDEVFERGFMQEREPGTAAFIHDLAREAVYTDTPWPRRRALHRAVAELLASRGVEPRLVADHWLAAGERECARPLLLEAAKRFCAVHAYRDASAAGRIALELWPEGVDESGRVEALDQLGRCAQLCGDLADATTAWEEAMAAIDRDGDPRSLAEVKQHLATVYELQGSFDKATNAHTDAAALFISCGLDAEAAAQLYFACRRMFMDDPHAATELLADGIRAAQRAGRADLEALCLSSEGLVLGLSGRRTDGMDAARRALALALAGNHSVAAVDAQWVLGTIANHWADYPEAKSTFEGAAELCRAHGWESFEGVCLSCLGIALYNKGEWDEAQRIEEDVLASGARPDSAAHAYNVLGMISAVRGATKRARSQLGKGLAFARETRSATHVLMATAGLAVVDELEQTPSPRWDELVSAQSGVMRLNHPWGIRWAAMFAGRRGDATLVERCTDALAGLASRFGNADALTALAHALGELAMVEGDAGRASEQFDRALELVDRLDAPFELAIIQMRSGVALAEAGEREAGVGRLVDAYRAFRRLRARPFWVQAAADLEALGELVDRRLGRKAAAALEHGGLTRRELEILRHIAVGRTNREIAHELVVSPRTVDMHVRGVLMKLGCRTRTEATTKAHELGFLDRLGG
jgi:class 3 adenylate cyclase/DNA-binding CsgD family transcriptional regulator